MSSLEEYIFLGSVQVVLAYLAGIRRESELNPQVPIKSLLEQGQKQQWHLVRSCVRKLPEKRIFVAFGRTVFYCVHIYSIINNDMYLIESTHVSTSVIQQNGIFLVLLVDTRENVDVE